MKGRKRHIVVDTLGFLLGIVTSAANTHDKYGLSSLINTRTALWSQLKILFADSAYQSPELIEECQRQGVELRIVKRLQGWDSAKGQLKTLRNFKITPKRWIVERTFAWLGRFRRFSKDYEFYPYIGSTFLILAMTRLILNRLVTGG